MSIQLMGLDHLVLTVANLQVSLEFYTQVLGCQEVTFGQGRKALAFGQQKINLHQAGSEFEPKARFPTPGSADLCFVVQTPLSQVIPHLEQLGVRVEEGPVARTGAKGPLLSIYLRDPDGNLLELSNPL